MKLITTEYEIKTKHRIKPFCIAVVADLHGNGYDRVTQIIKSHGCDIIAIPGDLMNGKPTDGENTQTPLEFLRIVASIAPTFYSLGNHDRLFSREDCEIVKKTGAVLLRNSSVKFGDILIGGLETGYGEKRQSNMKRTPAPDLAWLEKFASLTGFKMLLNHHPEYYRDYIKEKNIDLIISGHAHGGQIKLFGHGVFAPGQNFFPKYVSGVYDNRLVVSCGLTNSTFIPRLCNPTEVVFIRVSCI